MVLLNQNKRDHEQPSAFPVTPGAYGLVVPTAKQISPHLTPPSTPALRRLPTPGSPAIEINRFCRIGGITNCSYGCDYDFRLKAVRCSALVIGKAWYARVEDTKVHTTCNWRSPLGATASQTWIRSVARPSDEERYEWVNGFKDFILP